MLDRIRGFVKQFELPQDDEGEVVYRIIDGDRRAVEVSASQYARWRVGNDVAKLAVVGQDKVGDFLVKTTFSIMPENRSYRPFGTSAYMMPDFDPVTSYSRRYDTWREAELGHHETVELLRQEQEVPDNEAGKQNKEVEVVRRAFASGLPGLFQVEVAPGEGALVRAPWNLPDGSAVELIIVEDGEGYSIFGPGAEITETGDLRQRQVSDVCETLGVSLRGGALSKKAENAGELLEAVTVLAQAVVCVAAISR